MVLEGDGGKMGYGHGIVSRESDGAVCRPRKKLILAMMSTERRVNGVERGEEFSGAFEERIL